MIVAINHGAKMYTSWRNVTSTYPLLLMSG